MMSMRFIPINRLCGSLPIMLGDPRKVSPEKQKQLKAMSSWLRAMEEKHSVMLFRQDLPGFGEPIPRQLGRIPANKYGNKIGWNSWRF